jgi:hypothetical protein
MNERIIDIALQIKNIIKRNFIFPFVLVGQQKKSGRLCLRYHGFVVEVNNFDTTKFHRNPKEVNP